MLTAFSYFHKKQCCPSTLLEKFVFGALEVPVISVIGISSWAVLLCLTPVPCHRSLKVGRISINIPT